LVLLLNLIGFEIEGASNDLRHVDQVRVNHPASCHCLVVPAIVCEYMGLATRPWQIAFLERHSS